MRSAPLAGHVDRGGVARSSVGSACRRSRRSARSRDTPRFRSPSRCSHASRSGWSPPLTVLQEPSGDQDRLTAALRRGSRPTNRSSSQDAARPASPDRSGRSLPDAPIRPAFPRHGDRHQACHGDAHQDCHGHRAPATARARPPDSVSKVLDARHDRASQCRGRGRPPRAGEGAADQGLQGQDGHDPALALSSPARSPDGRRPLSLLSPSRSAWAYSPPSPCRVAPPAPLRLCALGPGQRILTRPCGAAAG